MRKPKDSNEPAALMTLEELASYLKISMRTAYGWVKEGKVPGFKIGNAWRFDKLDIQRWVQEQKRK